MHFFSGLLLGISLSLGSICVDGVIVETVYVSFVVLVKRIEPIYFLSVV
jgi:hypothetical protein